MFDRAEITFVSTANSGLSQIAAALLRHYLSQLPGPEIYRINAVDIPVGFLTPAPGSAQGRIELGVDYDLRVGELSQEIVNRADILVVMSKREREAVVQNFVNAAHKTLLLGALGSEQREVVASVKPSQQEFDRRRGEIETLLQIAYPEILRRAEAARRRVMSRLSMTTSLYFLELVPPSFSAMLDLFQQAGIPLVDWAHDMYENAVYSEAERGQFAEQLAAHQLKCEIVHGFEDASFHAVTTGEALDRYVDVQANRIELCARLGGHAVVLHIPGIFWSHLDISFREALEHATSAIDRLRPLCEELGITLALEDYGSEWSDRKARFDYFSERYPADFITFCFELREGKDNLAYLKQVEPYASRLSVLHVHEDRLVDDLHPPFFPVDWGELAAWLERVGYKHPYYIELMYRRRHFGGDPVEFLNYWVRRMREGIGSVVNEPIASSSQH